MLNSTESSIDLEVTPKLAWKMLGQFEAAKLIDVRTEPEWAYVGVPSIGELGKSLIKISWHVFPDMTVNPQFAQELRSVAEADDILLFICRSGGRSLAAANAAIGLGFGGSHSVLGGFEGGLDLHGHRATTAGWKHDGLPWTQA